MINETNDMATTESILQKVLKTSYTVNRASHYIEVGNKVLRISDHMPNVENFSTYNDEAKEVMIVIVNSDENANDLEVKLTSLEEDLYFELDELVNYEYHILDESDNSYNDEEYLMNRIEKFLA